MLIKRKENKLINGHDTLVKIISNTYDKREILEKLVQDANSGLFENIRVQYGDKVNIVQVHRILRALMSLLSDKLYVMNLKNKINVTCAFCDRPVDFKIGKKGICKNCLIDLSELLVELEQNEAYPDGVV